MHWCGSATRHDRLVSLGSSLTGPVCTCKQGLHSLYSCRLSSFTAWMSLSCAIRAWTFVRPSRPVISIFSIICCCLSIQYSQFSKTVSPTGCRILESSKTIRLAPAEGRQCFGSARQKYRKLLHYSPLFFTTLMLLGKPSTKTQAILGPLMQDWFILQTDDQINFFLVHQEESFCAQKISSVFKKHLEWRGSSLMSLSSLLLIWWKSVALFIPLSLLERLIALSCHTTGNKKMDYWLQLTHTR